MNRGDVATDAFYVVWCPQGNDPRVRHKSFSLASAEAARLLKLNPTCEFIVLKACESHFAQILPRINYFGK